MKRFIFALLLTIVTSLFCVVPVLAADPPDSDPTIESIKVYRNLIETGDRLFIIYTNTPYASIPDTTFSNTFIWQLIDTDGSTVLGSTVGYSYVNSGYGYQVYSMYFAAAESLTWNPVTNYTLRLIGNPTEFDDPPIYNYPVSSSYYTSLSVQADVRAELAADILTIADELDVIWGFSTSLITDDDIGRILSTFGQAYFRGCIYSLQAMAPDLFPLAVQNITNVDREWTTTYETDLEEQYTGTWIESAKAAGAALFGTDYDLLSIIILFALVIGVIFADIYLTNDHWNGLMDAAVVMVICAKLGLYALGYLALVEALCIIWIGIKLWQWIRG